MSMETARPAEQQPLTSDVALARRYPYAAMAKLGWVAPASRTVDRVTALREFFGVSSLGTVPVAHGQADRRVPHLEVSAEALAAWLRQGERLGRSTETSPFSDAKLRSVLGEIRSLTRLPPDESVPAVKTRLARCGVAWVLMAHLPRTGAHGATWWPSPERALVQMSLRYHREDIFWFSLFHALGHVVLHPRRKGILIEDGDSTDAVEIEADEFADDVLIPRADYAAFVTHGDWRTTGGVMSFARSEYISPGIVVGRLQHDKLLPHTHLNALRRRFVWDDEAPQG
jgi:HTH-type transcriptional regulator/antitoxin HigA